MGLLSLRGSQITTTTAAGTGYTMILTRERCLLVLEFFFCFFDQGIGSGSAAWASRVDVVWVSICVLSVLGCWSYVRCIDVFVWHCMPLVCIPNYYVMVRCNDIHLAEACQYAVLSLLGPSSSFRIESHIGCDKLVSEPRPTIGSPLIVLSLVVVESRRKLISESSYIRE